MPTAEVRQLSDLLEVSQTLGATLNLAFVLLNSQQFDRAYGLLDTIVSHPNVDVNLLAPIVDAYKQLNNIPKLELALVRLTQLQPNTPEVWYDLGTVRIALGKPNESLVAISNAVTLSNTRRATNPAAQDLAATARTDAQFAPLRTRPEFQKLLGQ